jgi:hypothetical protein
MSLPSFYALPEAMTKPEAVRNLIITGVAVAGLILYVKFVLTRPALAATLWALPPPGPL